MKVIVPEYFEKFKCVADSCKDSCCIGWEIPVDSATLKKYKRLEGAFAEEIAQKTQHGSFLLDKNGRCAFLDEGGLCRIISTLGEGYLCDICREHPRYYGVGDGCLEGGIGLCCEEGARLILSLRNAPRFTAVTRSPAYSCEDIYAPVSAKYRDALYELIYTARTEELPGIFVGYARAADNDAFDALSGINNGEPDTTVCPASNGESDEIISCAISALTECEPLDSDWRQIIEKTRGSLSRENILAAARSDEVALRDLIFYFTHRHVRECVEDMSIGSRIVAALTFALAIALTAFCNEELSYVKAAVKFSKNIEYSTSNMQLILDKISEIL